MGMAQKNKNCIGKKKQYVRSGTCKKIGYNTTKF